MNVRKLALDAIDKIFEKNAFSNIVVNEYLNKYELTTEDKSLFTNIVYGTVQYVITINYYLEPYITNKKTKTTIKHLLEMSIYQIEYLNIPDYAVVNEAVEIASLKDKNVASFVNAVLRNYLRNPKNDISKLNPIKRLSVLYSHPEWLVSFFLKDYKYEEVESILKENCKIRDEIIRINTLKATKKQVLDLLDSNNIEYKESSLIDEALIVSKSLVKTELFKKGLITMQGISSQLVSKIANPFEGALVLDLCSAPGGKISHMSALMNNTGSIYACDIYSHKIKLMENTFKRLGVKNVIIEQIDARKIKDLVKKESFDYVMADVPCSGLGVIGNKVDLKYHIDLESISEVVNLQKEILENTWELVKINGYYVYSTCTINKDENEKQIKNFIKENKCFIIEEEKQILPNSDNGDGFYICKLRRIK